MRTIFTITINRLGGFDVHARDVVADDERRARAEHLFEMGWSEEEVERELRGVEAVRRMNETPTCSLNMCREYCASYVDPGDIIVECGAVFVVLRAGAA